MATLGPGDFSGPFRESEDCGPCGSSSGPSIVGPSPALPSVDTCDTSAPGNLPVEDDVYQCSLGATLQPTIDSARRISHTLGFRPYRVFLVCQQRNSNREYREVCRAELMPVRVVTMESLDLTAEVWGQDMSGGISLREVSPQQVNEDVLRGFIDGVNWAEKDVDREFFYEVVMHARCAGHVPKRRRFTPSAEPYFKASTYEFRIALSEQKIARSRSGVDQTIATEREDGTPLSSGPRLVP